MALKKSFNQDECIGLSQEEKKLALKYLRKHKTAGALNEIESLKVYEMFMIGCSFDEIYKQFPNHDLGQIIMTAALKKWGLDRETMQHTLRDRVRAKVVKSVIEQVDFLTMMLSVNNAKHVRSMRDYIEDPVNNPEPSLSIKSIKEYKDVSETLYKIVQGATPGSGNNNSSSKTSPMFDALSPTPNTSNKKLSKTDDEDILIGDLVND